MRRVTFSMVALLIGLSMLVAIPAGATTNKQLKAEALSLNDMPTGWSVDNSSSGGTSNLGGCLKSLATPSRIPKGLVRVQVKYVDESVPALQENLISGKDARQRFQKEVTILNGCKSISFTSSDGTQVTGTVGAMSFPNVGASVPTNAFALNFTAKGISIGADIVLFRVGQLFGDVLYEDFSPDASTLQGFVTAAVNKIEGSHS